MIDQTNKIKVRVIGTDRTKVFVFSTNQIVNSAHFNLYNLYNILFRQHWTLFYRYSELLEFHNKDLPMFPKKQFLLNLSYEFISQRREQLQFYFDNLFQMEYIFTDTDIFSFFHFERYQKPEKTPVTLLDPTPNEYFNPIKTDTFDIFDRTTSSSSSSLLLATSSVDMTSLLYNTYSLCLLCSKDISKGQFEWIKCHVFQNEEKVYMRKICPIHGQIEYLLCSNISLFTKLQELQYDLCYMTLFEQNNCNNNNNNTNNNNNNNAISASPPQPSSSSSSSLSPVSSHCLPFQQPPPQQQQIPTKPLINLSLPYLESLLKYPKNSINHPLFITYNPYNNNKQIKNVEEIHNDILRIRVIYSLCEKFVLKLLCENLEPKTTLSVLNNCLNLLSSHFIYIQLLFEDIMKFTQDELLVFKKYTVMLNISLTVIKEKEIEIIYSLNKLLEILKPNSITCCISLNVEIPYPDLTNIIPLLRKYPEYFRIIIFNNKCFDSANSSCDINQLLTQIYENTNHTITPNDFFPLSFYDIFQSFVKFKVQLNYSFHCSPFSYLSTILVAKDDEQSVPLTKLINVYQLYNEIISIISNPMFKTKITSTFVIESIRNILNRSLIPPNQSIPDLLNYMLFSDFCVLKDKNEYMKKCQCLVVHNIMDENSVDLIRRCFSGDLTMKSDSTYSRGFVSSSLQF